MVLIKPRYKQVWLQVKNNNLQYVYSWLSLSGIKWVFLSSKSIWLTLHSFFSWPCLISNESQVCESHLDPSVRIPTVISSSSVNLCKQGLKPISNCSQLSSCFPPMLYLYFNTLSSTLAIYSHCSIALTSTMFLIYLSCLCYLSLKLMVFSSITIRLHLLADVQAHL